LEFDTAARQNTIKGPSVQRLITGTELPLKNKNAARNHDFPVTAQSTGRKLPITTIQIMHRIIYSRMQRTHNRQCRSR